MGRSFRLQGPLAWVGIGLAAVLGLALVVWLLTTLWILVVAAGLITAGAGLWRRLRSGRYGFGPRRWRKVTLGRLEGVKKPNPDWISRSHNNHRS